MSSQKFDFSDIRIILCAQGYSLDYQYIVREIGFWFNGHSGSIPFNCKINRKQLDMNNQKIITQSEEQTNGIRLKTITNNGLALSETKAVLRTLYHLNNNSEAKYIGITPDDNIIGLLFKAGLGSLVKNLNYMKAFENEDKIPTNEMIFSTLQQNPSKYNACNLHDSFLANNCVPYCAKTKAEIVAFYCINYQPSAKKSIQMTYSNNLEEFQSTSQSNLNVINF